jgi:hypothetical protein
MLAAADNNRDGNITKDELQAALQRLDPGADIVVVQGLGFRV